MLYAFCLPFCELFGTSCSHLLRTVGHDCAGPTGGITGAWSDHWSGGSTWGGSCPGAGALKKCPFNADGKLRLSLFLARANKPQQENKIFARSNGGRTWAPGGENSRGLWSSVGRLRGPKGRLYASGCRRGGRVTAEC